MEKTTKIIYLKIFYNEINPNQNFQDYGISIIDKQGLKWFIVKTLSVKEVHALLCVHHLL